MSKLTLFSKMLGLCVLCALGLASIATLNFINTREKVEDSAYAPIIEMKDLLADALPPPLFTTRATVVANEMFHADGPGALVPLKEKWAALEKEFDGRKDYWSKNLKLAAARSVLDAVLEGNSRVYAIGDTQLIPAVEAGDRARAQAALSALLQAHEQNRIAVEKLSEFCTQKAEEETNVAAQEIRATKIEVALWSLLIACACIAMGVVIARSIARRMRATIDVLGHVADGDLSARLIVDAEDEIGEMAKSLNRAFESVSEVLQRVRAVATSLASNAARLSASAEDISSGAQEQASSLEETAASLEEITATVRQSTGNAQQASQLAETSRDVATRGGAVVKQAVDAMDEVTRASRRIGDIITAIDEIALQTNLLALNAAVEAARAGEQGRGFAVVAAEVGNLAQRSAAAAKEVKSLVESTLERVEAGHALVGRSGESLSEIIGSVKRVTDIVAEIASASREQSAGVEQVNQAVTQMDQVTQGNAAQTEELSQTAQSLTGTAAELAELVGRFRLGDDDEPKATPALRKRAAQSARRVAPRSQRPPARTASRQRTNQWPVASEAGSEDEVEIL